MKWTTILCAYPYSKDIVHQQVRQDTAFFFFLNLGGRSPQGRVWVRNLILLSDYNNNGK